MATPIDIDKAADIIAALFGREPWFERVTITHFVYPSSSVLSRNTMRMEINVVVNSKLPDSIPKSGVIFAGYPLYFEEQR